MIPLTAPLLVLVLIWTSTWLGLVTLVRGTFASSSVFQLILRSVGVVADGQDDGLLKRAETASGTFDSAASSILSSLLGDHSKLQPYEHQRPLGSDLMQQ